MWRIRGRYAFMADEDVDEDARMSVGEEGKRVFGVTVDDLPDYFDEG